MSSDRNNDREEVPGAKNWMKRYVAVLAFEAFLIVVFYLLTLYYR